MPIHVNLRAGSVYTITGTATGRLFATFLPARQVRPLLEEDLVLGSRSRKVGHATSQAELDRQIAEIRSLGYATTEGIPVPGINAVAAPVFDHTGQMQYAITAIGNAGMLDASPRSPQAEAVLAARRAAWRPRVNDYGSGALWRYAQNVGPAWQGAVTHPGAKAETHVYADI